ncbi:MAG: hypothetical protein KF819_00155 [Labilithrix sp.]|nr:hypothetical protein [Labilithrix sp.]
MRRLAVLLPLLPLYALASCEDSGGTSATFDAGPTPVFDASDPPTDAAPADVDAGTAPVTVNVTRGGAPASGIVIVFGDAAGAVLGVETTDASGVAARVVPAGSQVTAIMGSATAPRLFTVTDVEPGDLLRAVDPSPALEDLNATVTVDGVPANAPEGNLQASAGGCASGIQPNLPLAFGLYSPCQVGGTFPLLVVARDSESGEELGFTFKKGNSVLFGDGGVASSITVQPTSAWSTAKTSHVVNVTKSPAAGAGGVIFYNEMVGGVGTTSAQSFTADPGAGAQARTFTGHPGYADFVQTTAEVRDYPSEAAISAVSTRAPTPTANTSASVDLSTLLPLITSATLNTATPARPAVSWTASGSLAAADGSLVVIRWFQETADPPISGTWSIVTSPTKTSVTFPALPASASSLAPSASASFDQPPLIVTVEASFIADYTALRAASATLNAPDAVFTSAPYGGIVPPLPAAGTLRATAWTRNND